MRRLLTVTLLNLAIVCLCSAAPCVSGTLATYIALGSSGCTIGTDSLSNFQDLSGTAGATEIAATAVTITPIGGTFSPGLSTVLHMTAPSGTILETMFTYKISGATFVGETITLTNSSETVDGAVSEVQNICEAGSFGPDGVTGCTGTPGSLLTLDGVQNQDSTTLDPPLYVNLTDDITLDGGLAGSATGGTFTDQFTAVPEPGGFFIAGLGLIFAIALKRAL